MNSPGTCESYLQTHLTGPLQVDVSRYISFHSDPEDPEEECKKVRQALNKNGPIHICILGLGKNGHLALNEPADALKASVHVAKLSESSLHHSMVADMTQKPGYGLTLGMGDILQSGLILLLISGSSKKEIARQFLSGSITPRLPASFLWLHQQAICLLDKEADPFS